MEAMTAERILQELIGMEMWTCRRAADMAMFHFGRRIQTVTFKGRPSEVGEYALHIQCAWRIVNRDDIAVASRDLYSPADSAERTEDFDWGREPNRRDELLRSLFAGGALIVRRVDIAIAGACRIEFDSGAILEIFPDDSLPNEHWRLFSAEYPDRQLVVSGGQLHAR